MENATHLKQEPANSDANSTRVSLNVRGCHLTQSELDQLNRTIQNEAGRRAPSTKLEDVARHARMEKQAFSAKLQDMLRDAGVDLEQPLAMDILDDQLRLLSNHPQQVLVEDVLARNHSLKHDFVLLQDHLRTVEMGKVATAAYGEWKQSNHVGTVQSMTRSAMYQLQNISGARLIKGELTFSLEGQAQRQLNFNRRFQFA